MIWRISVRELKLIVDLLRDILLQVWFQFDTETIHFLSVDPEKIASIELNLRPSKQEYTCQEPVIFSFYLQSLFKILRGAPKHEVAVLTCFRENPNDMVVRITGNDAQCFVIRRIQEPMPQFQTLPEKSNMNISMNGDDFYTMIRDLGAIGKLLNISVDGDGRVLFGTQDALGTTAEYIMNEALAPEEMKNMPTQSYIVKYAEKFTKPGLNDNLLIYLGRGAPIKFVWNMDSGCLALSVAPLPGKTNP